MHFFIIEVFCKKYMIFAFNVEKIHAELCKTLNIVDEVYDYFIRKKGLAKRGPFFSISFFFAIPVVRIHFQIVTNVN